MDHDLAKFSERVNFIWSIKECLRDRYKRHQYGDVILPLCVLRRLDCVLEPTKDKVLAKAEALKGNPDDAADLLAHVAGQSFYNTSKFTFASLLHDQHNIAENLHDYANQFSPNVRDAFDKFGFATHIDRMDEYGILYEVVGRYAKVDLHPDKVSNTEMGYIYEELIRVVADLSNEEAGEHFTPREVIRLMVNVLFADEDDLLTPGVIKTVCDPACGTGGMLTIAEEHGHELNSDARFHLFGQESQPESYAVCRSDMLIKGHDPANIVFGDSFTEDGFAGRTFDYLLANPPFGKDWKTLEKPIKAENAKLGFAGRFGAGLPSTTDGQLLFLQHMISKMKPVEDGGSRIAIVFNGSPLFTGDAGSGPSEIRRWIIENDRLEAIIGLPDQMFYNTGIYTYIWVVTNRKRPERQGFVQLIDARDLYAKMRKSLGNKRNELRPEHIDEITRIYEECVDNDRSKVLPNSAFGYRKIVVERPLRLRYEITDTAIETLNSMKPIAKLSDVTRDHLLDELRSLAGLSTTDRLEAAGKLDTAFAKVGGVDKPVRDAVWKAISVRDPDAPMVTNRKGQPEPDSELRDAENVPLDEAVDTYVAREVMPFVPDAWVDHSKTKVGYEIPFTRHFYRYVPPRPLDEIDAEIKASQQRILGLLEEVTTK